MTRLFRLMLCTTLVLACGFVSTTAHAAPFKKKPKVLVKNMDTNGDARISPKEWRFKPKRFKKVDSNEDGYITREELKSYNKAQRGGGGDKGNKKASKRAQNEAKAAKMKKDADAAAARATTVEEMQAAKKAQKKAAARAAKLKAKKK